ncbi:hypothetical protein [Haladaptatus halobius]|uniref:hypothetical protein n=1 Tax=Haladaptatus halobius TaxID=2884875 RepID=UPI001D0A94AC|nr:hypothetical protein [Haladaptatus halobius]
MQPRVTSSTTSGVPDAVRTDRDGRESELRITDTVGRAALLPNRKTAASPSSLSCRNAYFQSPGTGLRG